MDSTIVSTQDPITDQAQAAASDTIAPFLPGISYDDVLDKGILELMGAENMPPEEQQQILQTMLATIQSRVSRRIVDSLSDAEFELLKAALVAKKDEEFYGILARNKVDIALLYSEEALLYKIEMLNLMKATNKTAEE